MMIRGVVLSVALTLLGSVPNSPTATQTLSSMRKGCRLETTAGPELRQVWINCGCGRFAVVQPDSLATHVRITTPDQALEFLRFFSSPKACPMVPTPKAIEVAAGDEDGLFTLGRDRFEKLTRPTTVTASPGYFVVRRPLLFIEERALYEVEERVAEDGFVEVLGRRLLTQEVDKLGTCTLVGSLVRIKAQSR